MRKTFKKAIAVLLAVLMGAFSVPFTALAAPGDYAPNIDLRFATLSNVAETGLICGAGAYDTEYEAKTSYASDSVDVSGLFGAPINYNKNAGTLTLSKTVADNYVDALNDGGDLDVTVSSISSDYTYGEGDYFAVTMMINNINSFNTGAFAVKWTENVEPLGIRSYGAKKTYYEVFQTADEIAVGDVDGFNGEDVYEEVMDPGDHIDNQFSDSYYKPTLNQLSNPTEWYGSQHFTKPAVVGGLYNVDTTEPLSAPTKGAASTGFIGPDGTADYEYVNTLIFETYLFKIVGEGPIKFELLDPDNTYFRDWTGASCCLDMADDVTNDKLTTYAPNQYGLSDADKAVGVQNPGAMKMTFLGTNEWVDGEEECDHGDGKTKTTTETTTLEPTCTETGLKTVTVTCECGEVVSTTENVVIPALGHDWSETTPQVDATCGADGTTAIETCTRGCGATRGGEAITDRPEHNWRNDAQVDPGCATPGTYAGRTCLACGTTEGYGEIPATGNHDCSATPNGDGTHTWNCKNCVYSAEEACSFGAWTVTDPAAYQHNGTKERTCTVCGYVETETIPATDCEHTGTTHTVETSRVEATCTTDGTIYYDVVCDTCNNVIGNTTDTIDQLGHNTEGVVEHVDATCTTPGVVGGTYCTRCNDGKAAAETAIEPLGHNADGVVEHVDATCTTPGVVGGTYCTRCNDGKAAAETAIEPLGHNSDGVVEHVDATCTTPGVVGGTYCTRCNDGKAAAETAIEPLGHNADGSVEHVDATCTTPGVVGGTYCTRCNDGKAAAETAIEPLGHNADGVVEHVDATCTTPGVVGGTYCTRCNDGKAAAEATIDSLGHTPGAPEVTRVEPTFDNDGSITTIVKCTVCGEELSKDVQVLTKLTGYTVTVEATDLGYVTLAGEDVSLGGAAKFEEGTKVTLTATPVTGAKFVGWTANGTTLVSTAETFTTTVLANITYTPVFEVEQGDAFTVQFVDAYGNVVAIYKNVTVDDVANLEAPEVPNRPGYTSTGWAVDVKTVTSSAVIAPIYVPEEEVLYTVNVPEGATVMVNGAVVEAPYKFAFDTKVTVSLADTKAWVVGDTAVAYGESFTFFVTADVTLAVNNAVVAKPSVAIIGKDSIGATGAVQAMFKATRTMADGCKFIDAGFIYGKGNIGDAKLSDVNGSTIKASYVKTASEQFSLTYGLRAQTGDIQARAFLAYVDAEGNNQVVYTPVETYTYA